MKEFIKNKHLNPILRKELRVDSRSFKMPVALMLYGLFMTFVAYTILCIGLESGLTGNVLGLFSGSQKVNYEVFTYSFIVVAYIEFFIISFLVPILTAGTISSEREKQTLEIMMTTPMTTWQICLGKLEASLIKVIMFVFAALPAMSICFLYGGIQWFDLLKFVVWILAVSFEIGAIGVWCSSLFKKTIGAVVMTLLFEILLSVLPLVFFYYDIMIQEVLQEGTNYLGQVDFFMFLIILCPGFNFTNSIWKSFTDVNLAKVIFVDGLDGDFHSVLAMKGIGYAWPVLSLALTIGIGCLFLYWAARHLDRARRNNKRKSK